MDLREFNKLLNRGKLPIELNYNIEPTVDMERLLFNAFYRSYEFHESKFPVGYQTIPGFDLIIEDMANNAKTPLEEMEARQNVTKLEPQ
jgi:hypothetical protein